MIVVVQFEVAYVLDPGGQILQSWFPARGHLFEPLVTDLPPAYTLQQVSEGLGRRQIKCNREADYDLPQ